MSKKERFFTLHKPSTAPSPRDVYDAPPRRPKLGHSASLSCAAPSASRCTDCIEYTMHYCSFLANSVSSIFNIACANGRRSTSCDGHECHRSLQVSSQRQIISTSEWQYDGASQNIIHTVPLFNASRSTTHALCMIRVQGSG